MTAASGEAWLAFDDASPPQAVARGDVLVVNVVLDPAAPPAELLVEFRVDTAEHRAFWGENRIARGLDGSAGRHRLGPLPPAGAWVRLEIPAEAVGLPAGNGVSGLAVGVVWSARTESLAAWEAFERDRDDGNLPRAPTRPSSPP
ncbi:hypothetical protein [Urbifossiella limnaea]|uniref:Uncharacterized protein n=1 Tax=Urbifossiella limnaea TaxID=2528023 RepID=A0A517Y2A0_9BACT|nr:hypothetical protein [Urbifossiella limnaea]QDU23900.1 hypothetical protein ETAA1_59100 [Urbifossiella limnaea]